MGKKLSFTPLALATSIAAFALSAPNVPHMSSMVIATRGLFVGPVRIHGGSGVRRRLSARRAAIGGTVGVGGEIAPPAVAGAARAQHPELRRGRDRTGEARFREELSSRDLGPRHC